MEKKWLLFGKRIIIGVFLYFLIEPIIGPIISIPSLCRPWGYFWLLLIYIIVSILLWTDGNDNKVIPRLWTGIACIGHLAVVMYLGFPLILIPIAVDVFIYFWIPKWIGNGKSFVGFGILTALAILIELGIIVIALNILLLNESGIVGPGRQNRDLLGWMALLLPLGVAGIVGIGALGNLEGQYVIDLVGSFGNSKDSYNGDSGSSGSSSQNDYRYVTRTNNDSTSSDKSKSEIREDLVKEFVTKAVTIQEEHKIYPSYLDGKNSSGEKDYDRVMAVIQSVSGTSSNHEIQEALREIDNLQTTGGLSHDHSVAIKEALEKINTFGGEYDPEEVLKETADEIEKDEQDRNN